MPLQIVVCVKQVYDTSQLKFDDATGEMRPGAEQILNPYCEYAMETALRLKEAFGGEGQAEIIALSMGPASAKEAIKRAIAMGADTGFLLNDAAFEQADSLSTAVALAKAIETLAPEAQLVLLGQSAAEGATGATGPQLAALLQYPFLSLAKQMTGTPQALTVQRETEWGIETHEVTLPAVVAVAKCDYEPRMPNIKGVMKANRAEIPEKTATDIGLEPTIVGASGAATAIKAVIPRPARQAGQKLVADNAQQAAQAVVQYLQSRQLI